MGFFSMTLFKHPKTGGWYFRRVVPERLRKAVGKREIRESLGTKDPHEAKRKYPEVAARIQALLSSAAAPLSLDNQQVVSLSRGWYRTKLLHDQREPGEENGLGQLLDDLKAISAPKKRRAAVAEFVEEILSAATIVVDEPSRARLSDQVFEDYKRLLWVLIKRAEGDYPVSVEPTHPGAAST